MVCPIVFMIPQTSLLLFSHHIQASGQCKHVCVDKCIQTACVGWSKRPCIHSARSKCNMLYRLWNWNKSNFMIRNLYNSLAAVPGVIFSDVNFAFSCFVHNHRILFSANLVSYCFLHHQDTMSYYSLVSRTLCPWRCSKTAMLGNNCKCATSQFVIQVCLCQSSHCSICSWGK